MIKMLFPVMILGASVNTLSAAVEQTQPNGSCGLNKYASELAHLIKQHPSQKRPLLQCNQQLASIAQQRAEQLANNSANPNITPNQYLIKNGFRVPNYYPVTGNQVEAVARDFDSAQQAFQYLNQSGKHHNHVLGKDEFFELQSQIGVGFYAAKDATQHDQWVVLMAEPWQSVEFVFKQEFNMPVKVAEGCENDWQNSNNDYLNKKCRSMMSPRSAKMKRKKEVDEVKLKCDATNCEKQ